MNMPSAEFSHADSNSSSAREMIGAEILVNDDDGKMETQHGQTFNLSAQRAEARSVGFLTPDFVDRMPSVREFSESVRSHGGKTMSYTAFMSSNTRSHHV